MGGVSAELEQVIEARGKPKRILSDNGTEFTSTGILRWCQEQGDAMGLYPTRQALLERIHRELQREAS